jgi:DNA-binding transcriptional LysR family regulator
MAEKRRQRELISSDRLDAFVELVRQHCHYGNAAKTLGIKQPRLSQKIAELEAQLGVRLVERGPGRGGKQPTEAGLEFHARAVRVVQQLEEAQAVMWTLANQPPGTVRVGLTFENRERVAAAINAVVPKGARHRIVLAEQADTTVQEAVLAGQMHLGVVTSGRLDERLRSQRLSGTRLHVVVSKDHRLVKALELPDAEAAVRQRLNAEALVRQRKDREAYIQRLNADIVRSLDVELLERQRLVLARHGSARTFLNSLFRTAKFLPKIAIEVNLPGAAISLVRNNPELATILPEPPCAELRGLALMRLAFPTFNYRNTLATYLIWIDHARLSEDARGIADALRENFASGALVPIPDEDWEIIDDPTNTTGPFD